MIRLDNLDATRPGKRVAIIDTKLGLDGVFSSGPLTALITRSSVTDEELAVYISRFGLGPKGQYERLEIDTVTDVIELDRTIEPGTRQMTLERACRFDDDLTQCFGNVEFHLV